MKKAIIFLLVMLPMMVMSQTVVVKGYYKAFAGTAADTLTTADTKSYVLDLAASGGWSGKVYDATIQVFNDYVSDSLKYTLKVYNSVDGATWTRAAVDSTVLVKSKADQVYYKTFSAQSARYWKVAEIAETEAQMSLIYGSIYVVKH